MQEKKNNVFLFWFLIVLMYLCKENGSFLAIGNKNITIRLKWKR